MKVPHEAAQKLIKACRILDRAGVLDDLGHFSVRCDDGDHILMNAAMAPGQVTEKDLVIVNMEGEKRAGDRRPAREVPLHLAVYRRRPEVYAVAHTHSPSVVTLSIAGIPLTAVENTGAAVLPPEVPLYGSYGLVVDFDMANEVVDTMGRSNIVVLRGHGNLVAGASIEETCMTALYTERSARFQYQALMLGNASPFPASDREKLRKDFTDGMAIKRSWDYFEWLLENGHAAGR